MVLFYAAAMAAAGAAGFSVGRTLGSLINPTSHERDINTASTVMADSLVQSMITESESCVNHASTLQIVLLECGLVDEAYDDCMDLIDNHEEIEESMCETLQEGGNLHDLMQDLCTFGTIEQDSRMSINTTCEFNSEEQLASLQNAFDEQSEKAMDAYRNFSLDDFMEGLDATLDDIPSLDAGGWNGMFMANTQQIISAEVELTKEFKANMSFDLINKMLTAFRGYQIVVQRNRPTERIHQRMIIDVTATMITGDVRPLMEDYFDRVDEAHGQMDELLLEIYAEVQETKRRRRRNRTILLIVIAIVSVVLVAGLAGTYLLVSQRSMSRQIKQNQALFQMVRGRPGR